MAKEYILKYLPLFERDLAGARDYIAETLQNPAASARLVDEAEKAILKRLFNPESFQRYHSVKDRKQPYYTIYVKNYTVFYVVIGNIMEVRRFILSRRDMTRLV
ncbi:MAG: type II toxin-antitoxin system RelE/ParE family toxin [Oscillospiraceae bacterium]|nr:type II toxin-antitoxin system RelE/ParE family toxin [Oscillospiraceae bacterium]